MSNKATSADNQQGSRHFVSYQPSAYSRKQKATSWKLRKLDPSETTRRTPFSKKTIEAYLLGAIHDATFSSNKRYRFSQKGTEWLIFLQKLFKKIGYNSWIYKEGSDRDIYVLETFASFLNFSLNPLKLKSRTEKINYIRGFFDAEGGIPRNKNARFYIQLVQNDKSKLEKIKIILFNLGIETGKIHNPSKKVDPNYWRMYILSNSKNKFVRIIGS